MLSLKRMAIIKCKEISNENLIDYRDKDFFREFKISNDDILKFYTTKNNSTIEEIKDIVGQILNGEKCWIVDRRMKTFSSSNPEEFVRKMVKEKCFIISSSDENSKTMFKIGHDAVIQIPKTQPTLEEFSFRFFGINLKTFEFVMPEDAFYRAFPFFYTIKYSRTMISGKRDKNGDIRLTFSMKNESAPSFFDFLTKLERVTRH